MLRELNIENLVLIDHLRLSPREGINVITGETGSGKSMIIDALALLAGERGRAELIRAHCSKLLVEGVFDWPWGDNFAELASELGLDAEDNCLIISREITAAGRNTARINGRVFPLSTLRLLAPWLLNIHAQDDTQELLSVSHYLTYLDQFNPPLNALVQDVARQYQRYHDLCQQVETYEAQRQNWFKERDYLEYQYREVEAADLSPGEEEVLEEQRRLMKGAGQILEVCQQTNELLFEATHFKSAEELLHNAQRLISRQQNESAIAPLAASLNEIIYSLEDFKNQMGQLLSKLDFEPAELEAVEERLHLLARLFKKYGANSAAVIAAGQQFKDSLDQMSRWEEREHELIELREAAKSEYYRLAEQVSSLRQTAAQDLVEAIQQELGRLAMPKAQFLITVEPQSEPGPQGLDRVRFLFSDNPGQEPRPVHRIASGGEMSRLALALKVVLVDQIAAQSFVFDEIDAGMSGHALGQIAERIAALARVRQVLLVTHAPVVAAFADHHFVISKESSSDHTYTKVQELSAEQIIEQLVQMMGDSNATKSAYQYAEELRGAALAARQ